MAVAEPFESATRGAEFLDSRASTVEGDELDLSAVDIGDLLDRRPPPRAWIVENLIALGIVGILAAAGGVGKSMLKLLLAVAACAGVPWLGMPVIRSGSVLVLSAEDARDEIHRRLHAVMSFYRQSMPEQYDTIEGLVRERLSVLDRVGLDNRLTVKTDGQSSRTAFADRIIRAAKQLPGLVLIILDPLARFDGGEPNDNADATRLVEAAEHIRKETGATVLISHHVAKGSISEPESGQEAVRGASGLVDGARWVGLLSTLRRDHAERYGIEKDDAGQYVRFTAPKANYSAPWPGLWLKRGAGGVLVPTELEESKKSTKRAKGEDTYTEVLPKLIDLVRKHEIDGAPLTRRKLRDFAGSAGCLGVGDQSLRTILQRAIDEGDVLETTPEGKRHAELGVTK